MQVPAGDGRLASITVVRWVAAPIGTVITGFARTAAEEGAQGLFEHETRIVLGERDFARFAAAVCRPFRPKRRLARALEEARKYVRRA